MREQHFIEREIHVVNGRLHVMEVRYSGVVNCGNFQIRKCVGKLYGETASAAIIGNNIIITKERNLAA